MKNSIKIKQELEVDLGSDVSDFELKDLSKEIYKNLSLEDKSEEFKKESEEIIKEVLENFSFDSTFKIDVDLDEFSNEMLITELSNRCGVKTLNKMETLNEVLKYNKLIELWNRYSLEELERF